MLFVSLQQVEGAAGRALQCSRLFDVSETQEELKYCVGNYKKHIHLNDILEKHQT